MISVIEAQTGPGSEKTAQRTTSMKRGRGAPSGQSNRNKGWEVKENVVHSENSVGWGELCTEF